jgi:hypothetical protein
MQFAEPPNIKVSIFIMTKKKALVNESLLTIQSHIDYQARCHCQKKYDTKAAYKLSAPIQTGY